MVITNKIIVHTAAYKRYVGEIYYVYYVILRVRVRRRRRSAGAIFRCGARQYYTIIPPGARGGRSDICSDCSNNVCHALLCVFVSPAYYNVRSGALLKNGYSFRWLAAKRSRHINLSSTNNTIPRKSNRRRIGKIYCPGRFATTLCGIYVHTYTARHAPWPSRGIYQARASIPLELWACWRESRRAARRRHGTHVSHRKNDLDARTRSKYMRAFCKRRNAIARHENDRR